MMSETGAYVEQASGAGSGLRRATLGRLVASLGLAAVFGAISAVMYDSLLTSALLAPVAGIAVAWSREQNRLTPLIAGIGFALGVLFGAMVVHQSPSSVAEVALDALAGAATSGLVATVAPVLIGRFGRRAAVIVALSIVLVAGWVSAGATASTPNARGISFAENLDHVPLMGPDTGDAVLYYQLISRVGRGEPYHASLANVLTESNAFGGGMFDTGSVLSYRQPAMYWSLARLPQDGWSYIGITLLIGSIAAVAAFLIARELGSEPEGFVASALVGGYYAGLAGTSQLFNTEVWAGCLGLLSVMFLVLAAQRPNREVPFMYAAAGAAAAATIVRELAIAFLILGVIAVLFDSRLRSRRNLAPWLLGFTLAGLAYLAHVQATSRAIAALGPAVTREQGFRWLYPDGLGLAGAVDRLRVFGDISTAFCWLIAALGALGSLVAPRTTAQRVGLAGCVIGGLGILMVAHPPGFTPSGLPPAYWADLVLPVALACAPLAWRVTGPLPGRLPRAEQAE
jgi:hypothetical protein